MKKILRFQRIFIFLVCFLEAKWPKTYILSMSPKWMWRNMIWISIRSPWIHPVIMVDELFLIFEICSLFWFRAFSTHTGWLAVRAKPAKCCWRKKIEIKSQIFMNGLKNLHFPMNFIRHFKNLGKYIVCCSKPFHFCHQHYFWKSISHFQKFQNALIFMLWYTAMNQTNIFKANILGNISWTWNRKII